MGLKADILQMLGAQAVPAVAAGGEGDSMGERHRQLKFITWRGCEGQ